MQENDLSFHKDQYFKSPMDVVGPFEFNQKVADVFDDMVFRSIPFYDEIHRIICDLLKYHFKDGDLIYDLGCSTGTTIKLINQFLHPRKARLIGCDKSIPMLNKCQEKLINAGISNFELTNEDITDIQLQESGIVIVNYTLQFIPKEKRQHLLKKIYQSLRPGGILILSEKIESSNSHIQELITDLYYDFKRRNGYSELEISQKREALENVLTPLTPQEQIQMLTKAGFQSTDTIFRWYNFACFLGIKER